MPESRLEPIEFDSDYRLLTRLCYNQATLLKQLYGEGMVRTESRFVLGFQSGLRKAKK
jgi:hypothetical protein